MDTGIVPSVCRIFLFQGIVTVSVVIVTNLWDFKTFQASGASKDHDV